MLALYDFHELASIYRSLLAMGLLTGLGRRARRN
jgi:hypothetical protein